MKNKLLTAACASALLIFSGCATYQHSNNGFDASLVNKYVQLNNTTATDIREYLGTPTVEGVIKSSGKKFIGYGLVGNNFGLDFLKNMGKGMLFIFSSSSSDFTIKNVYFVLDQKNRVIDIKKNGYAYIAKHRLTHWNECEVKLTDAEVNSPTHYSGDEICKRYAQEVAKTQNISPDDVDTGKEFEACNIPCHVRKGAFETFGELAKINDMVDAEPYDGKRADELYGKEQLSNYSQKQDNN